MGRAKKEVIELSYDLEEFEEAFLRVFKGTHRFEAALMAVTSEEALIIQERLNKGDTDLGKAFNEFVKSAPTHPRVNRLSIIQALYEALEISISDQDTAGIVRCSQEINKMIDGNLASSQKTSKSPTLVGLIDLSSDMRKAKEIGQGKIIDIDVEVQEE